MGGRKRQPFISLEALWTLSPEDSFSRTSKEHMHESPDSLIQLGGEDREDCTYANVYITHILKSQHQLYYNSLAPPWPTCAFWFCFYFIYPICSLITRRVYIQPTQFNVVYSRSGNSVRLYFWGLQNHCRW